MHPHQKIIFIHQATVALLLLAAGCHAPPTSPLTMPGAGSGLRKVAPTASEAEHLAEAQEKVKNVAGDVRTQADAVAGLPGGGKTAMLLRLDASNLDAAGGIIGRECAELLVKSDLITGQNHDLDAARAETQRLAKRVSELQAEIVEIKSVQSRMITTSAIGLGVVLLAAGIGFFLWLRESAWLGLSAGGAGFLIAGTVARQILLWSKPITIAVLVAAGVAVVWFLIQALRTRQAALEQQATGMDAVKSLAPQFKDAFRAVLNEAQDFPTRRVFDTVRRKLKLGKYAAPAEKSAA